MGWSIRYIPKIRLMECAYFDYLMKTEPPRDRNIYIYATISKLFVPEWP